MTRWRVPSTRWLGAVAVLAAALVTATLGAAGPSAAGTVRRPTGLAAAVGATPAAGEPSPVTVSLDRQDVRVNVGQGFALGSTIRNLAPTSQRGLIAHIDIVGTDPARYVDPEDWCTARTFFLDDLGPGRSTSHTWDVKAVDSGPLLLWVTVSRPGGTGVVISAPVRLTVGEHIDVNSGGVLPVVVGVPAVVAAWLVLLTGWRRRLARPRRGPDG